jgi:hypothetical protein
MAGDTEADPARREMRAWAAFLDAGTGTTYAAGLF